MACLCVYQLEGVVARNFAKAKIGVPRRAAAAAVSRLWELSNGIL